MNIDFTHLYALPGQSLQPYGALRGQVSTFNKWVLMPVPGSQRAIEIPVPFLLTTRKFRIKVSVPGTKYGTNVNLCRLFPFINKEGSFSYTI
jgi:hypothetical protein